MNETQPTPTQQPSKGRRSRSLSPGQIIGLVVIGLLVCMFAGSVGGYMAYQSGNGATEPLSSSSDGNSVVSDREEGISKVAKSVSPSVVSIIASSEAKSTFYGPMQQRSAGTGIILSKSGYILTNKHVVKDADGVAIVTADGKTHKNVKVVGQDPLNDVAFLKVSTKSQLKPATLGNSTTVRIGQSVVAIGNALGQYSNTVTSGIISGVGRSVEAGSKQSRQTESLTDLLQTDAAINSGNSGGPLVNMAGQVIGINTAIASDANGIGFVIPISSTKGLIKEVLDTGQVKRAFIGVRYIAVTADVAKEYDLPVTRGAYVYSGDSHSAIVKGGPADKAGLKDKDIIIKVGNKSVSERSSVSSLIGEHRVGDTVDLTIRRGNRTLTKSVTLDQYKP